MEDIIIGNRLIGEKHSAFIIAEIGLNHQGDINLAKKLIDAAVDAGADAVKFQKRSFPHLYKKDALKHPEHQEHGFHYSMGHVMKCEFSEEKMADLYRYSVARGIQFICTPWEEESLRFLSTLNLPAYKIGSPDMFNLPLIKAAAALKKPLIVSTGMSFVSEIEQVIEFLNQHNAKYVMLHCNSTYPSAYHDINLNFLKTLSAKSRYPVGYSGHEQGIATSVAAVALGAKVIERHLTSDKNLPGPDHRASLEPEEFKELVKQIRIVEKSLGEPVRYPSRGEFLNRENLSKSLVVNRDVKKGEILNYEDIGTRSPGIGTKPLKINSFIGRKVISRDLEEGDYLLESDIDYYKKPDLSDLEIKHKWGIVIRMSDIDQLLHSNPGFVEVYLRDSDIRSPNVYTKQYDVDMTVHAPIYDGDLVLDLSCLDEAARNRSIVAYNEALDYARKIKKLFKNKNKIVKFVVHPGGFGITAPLLGSINQLNANLLDSLKKLNAVGFELLVENMPACPWVFGGQWYHSSFMNPEEIVNFSKQTGYGVVFDTSHAALYCNYYKKSLEDFIKTILPVTRHVHISDAAGFNGEGLKIGDGTIDFKMVLSYLVKTDFTFLAEIWQGHKFGGEDFINAVRALKTINPDF